TDLGDDDVDVVGGHRVDARFDLVGDVRDDLHGVTEVGSLALLGDHTGVDLAGGDIGRCGQFGVQKTFVVSDVQVGLGLVLGDTDIIVFVRVAGRRVDVEVGVERLHGVPPSARLEAPAQAGSGQAFAKTGGDGASHDKVLGTRGGCQD